MRLRLHEDNRHTDTQHIVNVHSIYGTIHLKRREVKSRHECIKSVTKIALLNMSFFTAQEKHII